MLKTRYGSFLPYKKESFFRILLIGDSFVWGDGANADETLPYILENTLNAKSTGSIFEVINLSQPGYSMHDYLAIIKLCAQDYQPDLILTVICNNDAEVAACEDADNYKDHIIQIWDKDSKFLGLFEDAVKEAKDWCNNESIPLGLIFYDLFQSNIMPQIPDILSSICNKYSIFYLNLIDNLKHYDPDSLVSSSQNKHPNYFANQIAARSIALFLFDNNLLPPGRGPEFNDKMSHDIFDTIAPYEEPYIWEIQDKLPEILKTDKKSEMEKIQLQTIFEALNFWINSLGPNESTKLYDTALKLQKLYKTLLITDKNSSLTDLTNGEDRNVYIESLKTATDLAAKNLHLLSENKNNFKTYFSHYTFYHVNLIEKLLNQGVFLGNACLAFLSQNNQVNINSLIIPILNEIQFLNSIFNLEGLHILNPVLNDFDNYVSKISQKLKMIVQINNKSPSGSISAFVCSYVPYYINYLDYELISQTKTLFILGRPLVGQICFSIKDIKVEELKIYRNEQIIFSQSMGDTIVSDNIQRNFYLNITPFFLT